MLDIKKSLSDREKETERLLALKVLNIDKCLVVRDEVKNQLLCAVSFVFNGELSVADCAVILQDRLYEEIGMAGNFRAMCGGVKNASSNYVQGKNGSNESKEDRYLISVKDGKTHIKFLILQDELNDSSLEEEFEAMSIELPTFAERYPNLVVSIEQFDLKAFLLSPTVMLKDIETGNIKEVTCEEGVAIVNELNIGSDRALYSVNDWKSGLLDAYEIIDC